MKSVIRITPQLKQMKCSHDQVEGDIFPNSPMSRSSRLDRDTRAEGSRTGLSAQGQIWGFTCRAAIHYPAESLASGKESLQVWPETGKNGQVRE